MGYVINITHDQFPEQKADLNSLVSIVLNGKQVAAQVVRSDAESPYERILKTREGLYIADSEVDGFKLPEQRSYLNKRAGVCFHFNSNCELDGKIVRADKTEPFRTVIQLDDGRVVYDTECQFREKWTLYGKSKD